MGWGRSMSALTSSMARSWSEVSTNGNDDSSSACQGCPGEGVPGDLEPATVEGHQLLGDLVHRRPGLGAGPLPLGATQPAHRGRVTTGVGREQVDLVGGQIQLVRPPVPRSR